MNKMNIDLLGIPLNSDGTLPENENPAKALRDYGLISSLTEKHNIKDHGDITITKHDNYIDKETGILNLNSVKDISFIAANRLKKILNSGNFSIVLGGDCSILIGIYGAFAYKNLQVGLVFFDAHADFHSTETSETGEVADFELALLTGRGPKEITNMFGKCPLIFDDQVVAYGIRDYDLVSESDIEVFSKDRLLRVGIPESVRLGIDKLSSLNKLLWLHFDVDVIDPSLVPVIFPSPGGLTFEQSEEFLTQVLSSEYVIGISIACYHPNIDPLGTAGKKIVEIISNSLNKTVI